MREEEDPPVLTRAGDMPAAAAVHTAASASLAARCVTRGDTAAAAAAWGAPGDLSPVAAVVWACAEAAAACAAPATAARPGVVPCSDLSATYLATVSHQEGALGDRGGVPGTPPAGRRCRPILGGAVLAPRCHLGEAVFPAMPGDTTPNRREEDWGVVGALSGTAPRMACSLMGLPSARAAGLG